MAQFRQVLGRIIEYIRGPRTIQELEVNGVLETCLTGTTLRGIVINITCRQTIQHCKYQRWWVRDKELCMYQISCTYEGDPPDQLVSIMTGMHNFPNILSSWTSHAAQREAAIGAFLDILVSRLSHRGERKIPIGI